MYESTGFGFVRRWWVSVGTTVERWTRGRGGLGSSWHRLTRQVHVEDWLRLRGFPDQGESMVVKDFLYSFALLAGENLL